MQRSDNGYTNTIETKDEIIEEFRSRIKKRIQTDNDIQMRLMANALFQQEDKSHD